MRFVVVGTSGSGKTTFAKELAARLNIPHIELDAFNWEPDWTPAAPDMFRTRVEQAIGDGGESSGKTLSWVVDGNYDLVRDRIWSQADTLIWLDYSFPRIFTRALLRTLKRVTFKEELWAGNRETFRKAFLSKDSILLWVLKTYWRRKREYPVLMALPQYRHLQVVRLKNPKTAEEYLLQLPRL